MIDGIDRIDYYLEAIGIVSIAVWALALLLVVAGICRLFLPWTVRLAIPLATAGYLLAGMTADNAARIETDFSAAQAAARTRAGESGGDGAASRPATAPARSPYAYRRRGPVKRAAGSKTHDETLKEFIANPENTTARNMNHRDVARANRLAGLNRAAATCVLWLAILVLVIDYFLRFNRTFDHPFPLPVAGRFVDAISRASRSVCVRDGRGGIPDFLKRAVRKGETFIYCGRSNPLDTDALPRLPLGTFLPHLPRLDTIVTAGGNDDFDEAFLLESAWFGRYCFVVLGEAYGGRLLKKLIAFLDDRRRTRAAARRIVNVVIDLPTPPDEDTLGKLIARCAETNYRLVLYVDGDDYRRLSPLCAEAVPGDATAGN